MVRKPEFFIVGAPRCGTTSLTHYLNSHPDVEICAKDVYFFGEDLLKQPTRSMRKMDDVDQYLRLFSRSSKKCVGETSVWYLYSQAAPNEIKQFVPSAKIIIMLRNPIDMLMSLHRHYLAVGNEVVQDFGKALEVESERKRGRRIPRTLGLPLKMLFYREIVKFSEQTRRYFETFGRDACFVVIFDEFVSDTKRIYRDVLRFLNVHADFEPSFVQHNPRKCVSRLPLGWLRVYTAARSIDRFLCRIGLAEKPYTRQYVLQQLARELSPEIKQLGALLERDLSHWSQRWSAENGK